MADRLSDTTITSEMAKLPDWKINPDHTAITRQFTFRNFSQAFSFMTRAAMLAEQMNHHPEWANVYHRVTVTLTTHDAGGLSALDIKMAHAMNTMAAETGVA
jgi:4a-hydroxytetrahydrobiopterin dehydratase